MSATLTPSNSTIVRTIKSASMKASRRSPENTPRVIAVALGGWALCVALAGSAGAFARIPPSLFALLVVLGAVFAVATYYLDRGVRAAVDAVELRTLTLVNLWRIPAGIAFLSFGAAGLLPEEFARNAGWGDLAVGAVALLFLFRNGGAASFLAFHLAGLADLAIAVGTGVALTGSPQMATLAQFPLVMIPAFAVAVTAAVHVAAIDRLLRSVPGFLRVRFARGLR